MELYSVIARIIERRIYKDRFNAVCNNPAVAILGPRQVGKTTLALEVRKIRPSLYLDLESAFDRAKLSDPERYLTEHEDELGGLG